MSPDGPPAPPVKYPFEIDGRWALRYHVPYAVEYEGGTHMVLADLFAEPAVHGRITVSRAGELVARHDDLTPGDTVEITGDTWRVTGVEYRTRVVLERAPDARDADADAAGGPATEDHHEDEGATDVQAGR
ncbi:DUF6406 domain-containing protein [Streptomyces sp. NPDC091268]|uniref:DUF6406 domain-containing protein n=1 Tax=Streptomyces sp. NPDC091268 TaxID=3365979 RepID=UPI0038293461